MRILQKDRGFKNKLLRFITDPNFAKVVGELCGLKGKIRNFGDKIRVGNKDYQPIAFQIPVRLYCPNCHNLCPEWAKIVNKHPHHPGPHFAALCKNVGKCPRADMEPGYDGYVWVNPKDHLDMTEFHFMLDPLRDFISPFKADCHIFGGDYFQLTYEHSGVRAIDKIERMFRYAEAKTGQRK